MARNLFGGTAADVAEDAAGVRAPGALGSVWDGPSAEAVQVIDLTDSEGLPIQQLTADANGMVPSFYGPEDVERLWVDFGAGKVALVATNAGERLAAHVAESDPHGTLAEMQLEIEGQKGVPNGLATLDANGRVPAEQIMVCSAGSYVPPEWGANWRTKRDAAAGGGKARIVVVGGSSSQGFHSSDFNKTSWVGKVRLGLQAQYGDGGSGMITSSWSGIFTATKPIWETNGTFLTYTGTWTAGANRMGPGVGYIVTERIGSSATYKVNGTTVSIYTLNGITPSSSRAPWTYSVDGSAPVTVTPTALSEADPWRVETTTITGLAEGDHTVTITWAGTADNTNQFLSICGVSGENASGIVVDNLAKSGAESKHYAFIAPGDLNADWNGGKDYPADLIIYTAAPNDAVSNVTAVDWGKNLAKYLGAVRSVDNGSTDVMIVLPHTGNHGYSNYVYQDYAARGRGIAETYGAAFVNMWALGRTSWAYWNSLGYWGDSTTPGVSGTDGVHPSDLGHAFIADTVLPILKS